RRRRTQEAADRQAERSREFPETSGNDSETRARSTFAGNSSTSSRGRLLRRQDCAVWACGLHPSPDEQAAGSFRRLAGGIQSTRLWAGGGKVSRWFHQAGAFLRLSPEVLALYPGQFGRGREGGKFGANSGAASSGLGWTSVVVRVRPAEDHRCGMGEERESDEMEFGLCLRHAGVWHRCGAVLALSTAAKRKRRKLGGLREVCFFQGPQVLR